MECPERNIVVESDEPTLVHRAIDCLSAAQLDVQRIRRRPFLRDGLAEDMERLDATLHELGALLIRMQETG